MTFEQSKETIHRRFDSERKLEDFFVTLIDEAKTVAAMRFQNLKSAEEYAEHYVQKVIKTVNEIPSAGDIQLKLDGPGVLIPNMTVRAQDNSLTFEYNADAPLIPKPQFDEKIGVMTAVLAPVTRKDDGMHSVLPTVVFKDSESIGSDISYPDGPLAQTQTSKFIYALCDGTAEITVPALDRLRAQVESLGQMAVTCAPEAVEGARILRNALYSENSKRYTKFKRVDVFTTIASSTIEEPSHARVVAESMLHVLSEGRVVVLKGDMYKKISDAPVPLEITGTIIEVLPFDPQSQADKPTIALEVSNDNAKHVYYAPFDSIHEFRF